MRNLPALAPEHNKGFIIVTQQHIEWNSTPFVISFYGYSAADSNKIHNRCTDYFIGSIVGDPYNDAAFKKKLEYIRAYLDLKGVVYTNTWSRMSISKAKRLDNEQKYKRSISKLTNSYNRKLALAMGSLFADAKVKELDAEYHDALIKIKNRYEIL